MVDELPQEMLDEDAKLLDVVSNSGAGSPIAWCRVRECELNGIPTKNAMAMLTAVGLFIVGPTGMSLQPLGAYGSPEELHHIKEGSSVSMVHSPKEAGIYVFVTPRDGAGTHWFFDMGHCGYWPMSYTESHQPLWASLESSQVVVGCKDGHTRSIAGPNDDGRDVDSYAVIGPLRIGPPGSTGILTSIRGTMECEDSVPWRIIAGESPEQVCHNSESAVKYYQSGGTAMAEAYSVAGGTWHGGKPVTKYPRARAPWVCVLLKANAPWSYGAITIESRGAGG